jgi:hypothetical protein
MRLTSLPGLTALGGFLHYIIFISVIRYDTSSLHHQRRVPADYSLTANRLA